MVGVQGWIPTFLLKKSLYKMQKKAVIIGASSGIGRALAERLAKDGYKIGVAARRRESLEQLQAEFGAQNVVVAEMDVVEQSATAALDTLLEQLGAPDLFLYVSGKGGQNPDLDEQLELDIVTTNCEGMVRVVDHFVNYVKRQPCYTAKNRAHIAVVTSVAGTTGMGPAPAYSASKSMQSTYITALVQHCRMYKVAIDFTDIRPGFVATPILNPNKHYPMLMSLEQATRHIMRGLKRRRRIVIFDWRFRLLVLFWNIIPRWLWERLTIIRN